MLLMFCVVLHGLKVRTRMQVLTSELIIPLFYVMNNKSTIILQKVDITTVSLCNL